MQAYPGDGHFGYTDSKNSIWDDATNVTAAGLILMNADDMRARGLAQGDLVDITATARDGSVRVLHDYRALRYDMPRGNAAGYMPEMNVLVAADDYSSQSDQPLMKNIRVRVTPSGQG
jgi:anaerobic selenocysteine-containing dehydrogenase